MTNVLLSPHAADGELVSLLKESGSRVRTCPVLAIGGPADDSSLREAMNNLFGYDWLILKNARAVEYLTSSFIRERRRDELDKVRVLAIGSETCAAAGEHQIHVDIAIERFAHAKVSDEIRSYVGVDDLPRLNILLPTASVSRELFEEQLEAGGARVDSATAYRTCSNTDDLSRLKALLAGGGIDCVAFTAASAIDEFACLFDTDDLTRLLDGVAVICADQSAARAAGEFGLRQTLLPAESSAREIANLIKAIE